MAPEPRVSDDGAPLRRSSAALARLRRLSRRRDVRREESLLLVDGPVLLADAVETGAAVVEVFVEEDSVLTAEVPAGVPVRTVASGELAKVLDVVTPRGVVAVVRRPQHTLAEVLARAVDTERPVVVLVGIQDPGNAGTLVRVAEASDAAGVVLTDGSVDVWSPKAVRASAGSALRVPVVVDVPCAEVLGAAADLGLPTVGTVPVVGEAPESTDLAGAFVLLLGNEAHGLPEEAVASVGRLVSIPMSGAVESVNAGVAGAVLLFEAARQRRAGTGERSAGGGGS